MIKLIDPDDMDQKRPDRLLRQPLDSQHQLGSFSSLIEHDSDGDIGRSP